MEENNNPFDDLKSSTKEYLNMKLDEGKLTLAKNLATIFNRLIFYLIIIILCGIAFAFLASTFSSWMEFLLESKTLANLITFGICLAVVGILFIFKERLFTDSMVRLFVKMLFDKRSDGDKK